MFGKKKKTKDIEPDEIFLDSRNLPDFDQNSLEGQIEKPLSNNAILLVGLFFFLIIVFFLSQLWGLQVERGEAFNEISRKNTLNHEILFSKRGVLYDRNGQELAWSTPNENFDFETRQYTDRQGLYHLLGFLRYPAKDSAGFYWSREYEGRDGAELALNEILNGINGLKIRETNVFGEIISESTVRHPEDGQDVELSVDARLNNALFEIIESTVKKAGFETGSGVMMDVETGEIIVMVNYPEYDSQVLTDGEPQEVIEGYASNPATPYMNRVVSGNYTPGSIMKPFVAIGALNEGIISPNTFILSTRQIVVPNPYFPSRPSIFYDWQAHGRVTMRQALALSSNVYFYNIGGGFGEQEGLGINRLEKYSRLFGFGNATGIELQAEARGVIPNPEWKAKNFDGDPWRLGDTYLSAIGQYGYQVTLLQTVRAYAALANGGKLLRPQITKTNKPQIQSSIPISTEHFQVIREGLRQTVIGGTAQSLGFPEMKIAAKTGTAEVGKNKEYLNSWLAGFYPFDEPRYAFAVVMEKAPRTNLTTGGLSVTREFFRWVIENAPEYITD